MAQSSYLDSIADKQSALDALVRRFTIKVVGTGYIDIIVSMEHCSDFIGELADAGFLVEALSWWCHATDDHKRSLGCPHGLGGPMTNIGWFSEIAHEFDELSEAESAALESDSPQVELNRINQRVAEMIRDKRIGPLEDGRWLLPSPEGCLTPGLWVRVPESWSR